MVFYVAFKKEEEEEEEFYDLSALYRLLMNTMDKYNEKMNDVGAISGHWTRVFRLRGETCNCSTTAAPFC